MAPLLSPSPAESPGLNAGGTEASRAGWESSPLQTRPCLSETAALDVCGESSLAPAHTAKLLAVEGPTCPDKRRGSSASADFSAPLSPSTEANSSDASDCEERCDRDSRGVSAASSPAASCCDGGVQWEHTVRFARSPIILGEAASDYDRRPIRVDLSKTPYALFHKDAVLLKNPKDASPSHNGKRPAPPQPWSEDCDADVAAAGADGDSRRRSVSDSCSSCGGSCGGSSGDRRCDADGSGSCQCGSSSSDDESECAGRPNFSGVWRRDRAEGFEELLRFSGVEARAAARAASRAALHVIDHDDDYFRLIIKNGLVKVDSHYIIGDESRCENPAAAATAGKPSYCVTLFWGDGTGDGVENNLVLSSVDAAAGKETIAIRTLSDDGDVLVLQQIVRFTDGTSRAGGPAEARCKHYFSRVKDRNSLRAGRQRPKAD